MRTLILIATLLLTAPAALGAMIGIYLDPEDGPYGMGTAPCAWLDTDQPLTLYIVAFLDELSESGITAAEFRVSNWLGGLEPDLHVSMEYSTDLVIGDPGWDLAMAWNEPVGVGAERVLLATATIYLFDPEALSDDHWMTITEGYDCDCLVLVNDLFEAIDVYGDRILIYCNADCGWCDTTPTGASSWSTLKSLY